MIGFTGFSPSVIGTGALVLAAALFALHRLRVRREVVRVPTAMFWRMAVQAAPARILHERFRHWLAYLLAVAIALALWLAGSGPQRDAAGEGPVQVFFLDASAAMTAPGAFDAARAALLADVRGVPAARRSVWLGDLAGKRLLAPGENLALLPARLAAVRPGAFPSIYPQWTRRRLALDGAAVGQVRYYGLAAAWQAGTSAAPAARAGYLAPAIAGNRGIVALGASPAASGAWDKADVLIQAMATKGAAPAAADMAVQLGGRPLSARLESAGPGLFLLHDLPADGRTLAVALRRGDGFAADDAAALRLPRRPRIRVAVSGAVPAALRGVIAADPALQASDATRADVIVRGLGAAPMPGRPALILADARAQGAAFRFILPGGGDEAALAGALDQMGLARFDAAAMADALHRPIGVEMVDGPGRAVGIWADLLADGSGFARSPAMPLMVSQALRWLASPEPWIASAPAGGAPIDLDRADGLAEAPDLAARRLGGTIMLGEAGLAHLGKVPLAVSLLDPATTRDVAQPPPRIVASDGGEWSALDLPFLVLILVAGALLAVEWVLFQRRWMP